MTVRLMFTVIIQSNGIRSNRKLTVMLYKPTIIMYKQIRFQITHRIQSMVVSSTLMSVFFQDKDESFSIKRSYFQFHTSVYSS